MISFLTLLLPLSQPVSKILLQPADPGQKEGV
jgi:hypothetical protein